MSSVNQKEKEFHESRVLFALHNGLLIKPRDDRNKYEWLCDELGYTKELVDQTIIGYIRPIESNSDACEVNIVTYIGVNYECCEPLQEFIVEELVGIAIKEFGADIVNLCTGVKVGLPGDVWPILRVLDSFVIANSRFSALLD